MLGDLVVGAIDFVADVVIDAFRGSDEDDEEGAGSDEHSRDEDGAGSDEHSRDEDGAGSDEHSRDEDGAGSDEHSRDEGMNDVPVE